MARPGKFDHLKEQAFSRWQEGGPLAVMARDAGVPRNTMRGWIEQWEAGVGIPTDTPEATPPRLERKPASPVSKFRQREPSPPSKVVSIDGGRAQAAAYLEIKKTTMAIMKDPNQPGAVRIQAANVGVKLIDLSARLPKHILMEEEQHSLGASVEEVEGRGDEQIAQDYRELLG